MLWFILALVTAVLAVVGILVSRQHKKAAENLIAKHKEAIEAFRADRAAGNKYGYEPSFDSSKVNDRNSLSKIWFWVGVAAAVVTVLFVGLSTLYTQSVGQAKVIINLDGTVAGEDLTPGLGVKAPWQRFSNWDLFSQEVTFAGNGDGTPSYTGGTVTGYEITSAVARGAQTNFDMSVTYTLDADNVSSLYPKYREQERFTKQVIEKTILSISRDIPPAYTPVEFRGDKRGEATELMTTAIADKLKKHGITDVVVNLQNVRYTEEVEESIKQVEVAQQKEETAQAELRATTVSAQAKVVEAQAEADANAILTASLSPEVLQQRALDALVKIGNKGNTVIVPEGFGGILQLK